jgi:hypothetical protein
MRFMMMVKGNEKYEAGEPPPRELMEAVGKLEQESRRAGVVLQSGGLAPSSKGAKIRVSRGRITVIDGPFAEAKELVGGYAIIEAGSREEAIEHGKRFMQVHVDVLGREYEGELEVRQLVDYGNERC